MKKGMVLLMAEAARRSAVARFYAPVPLVTFRDLNVPEIGEA
jgi:hypothetical protein